MMMYSPVLTTARMAYRANICVLPPAEDGSKRPDVASWASFQDVRPSREQMLVWYGDDQRTGVGLLCGEVSSGLECFEFDDHDTYVAFRKRAKETGLAARG